MIRRRDHMNVDTLTFVPCPIAGRSPATGAYGVILDAYVRSLSRLYTGFKGLEPYAQDLA